MFSLKIIHIILKKKTNKEKIEKNIIGFISSDLSDLKADKNTDNLLINKNINKNNILNFLKKRIERNYLRSSFEFSFIASIIDFYTDMRRVFIERAKKKNDPDFNQEAFEAVSSADIALTLFF